MYNFTSQIARLAAPTPGELRLFEALAASQRNTDQFIGALAGVVPLREFMSPRNVTRLVGLGGLLRLIAGQAAARRLQPAQLS
jgi:hypothetical protein